MSPNEKHDYYEILAVPQTATKQEIAIAYEKAKRTYSAQNPALYTIFNKQEAEQLQQMIDEAFAVLGNDVYRNIYEKRRQAMHQYSDNDLSIDAIKAASKELVEPVAKTPEQQGPSTPVYAKDETFEEEIQNQTVWSGDFLRKVREYKKFSLEALHEKTKINPWYINAIENMDAGNLPAPVFVRGYIIQIARCLHLDDKLVADSYMKLYRQALEN